MADRVRSEDRSVVLRPLRDFLHTEAAGGVALLLAAAVALVWANSPWQEAYVELWDTVLPIDIGDWELALDLRGWINEGLMTIFFLVVGLEIKRELVDGELREPRRAALPAIAAVGGMIVPAALYLAVNAGGDGSSGWAIPMATDIAIAVGVVSLLGARIAPSLKIFLLTLAIADDVGAIAVIAIVFSEDLDVRSILIAAGHRDRPQRSPGGCMCNWLSSTSCSASLCGWRCTSPASTPRSPASSWA